MIRFYFKRGKWHVTSDKKPVPAVAWWNAVNEVKCMNHKLRTKRNVPLLQDNRLQSDRDPALEQSNVATPQMRQ